jgi:hypothetical protein
LRLVQSDPVVGAKGRYDWLLALRLDKAILKYATAFFAKDRE